MFRVVVQRLASTAVLAAVLVTSHAQAAHGNELWTTRIQPLFDVQCVKCHGPIEQKSGLELDTPEAILKGGDEGVVVVPGSPEKSRLYLYLAADSDPHMPPKKQLSDAERDFVRNWILSLTPEPSADPNSRHADPSDRPRNFPSIAHAIDFFIAQGWARLNVAPAPDADDATWCRRVHLDLAGRIPTSSELQAFLQSTHADRREILVDRLLASDEYPVRMRELWDVFLMGRVKRDAHEDRRRQNGWWTFLETSFRSNRPWDDVVHELLLARPDSPDDQGASWFLFERRNDHQGIAEAVAPLVYGTKIDCAQCHDHPLAREIRQAHYWGLVAAYNRSKNIDGTNSVSESAIGGNINFTNLKKESQPARIVLLDGRTLAEERNADGREEDSDDLYIDPQAKVRVPRFSRRKAFADAATTRNPLLARAFVNRMWATFIGRGLVHPADEMTARNVPSHPELLDWLANDFAEHRHDMRRFVRGLVLSRAYGLGFGAAPPESFAAAIERPMTAEQLARSWRVAVGAKPDDDALRRAAITRIPEVMPREYAANVQLAQFLTYAPSLTALFQPDAGTTPKRLVEVTDVHERARQTFQSVLGRVPDREETDRLAAFFDARADAPGTAVRDGLWALMTSAEFLTVP